MKAAAILSLLGALGLAGSLLAAVDTDHALEFKGLKRTFRVFVPELPAASARPVVLALHGGATDGGIMARFSGLDTKAAEAGFIAVYPDGTGRLPHVLTWNSGDCCGYAQSRNIDDVGFLRAVMDFVLKTYGGDPARVYVLGISNGAMMAYRFAAEAPDLVAAVAAIAGSLDFDPRLIKAPKPVIHFHGTDDEFIPWNGGRGPKTQLANEHRSVPDTIAAWVRANGADPTPETVPLPDTAKDGTAVIRHLYSPPSGGGCEVVLYEIRGGGHTWPGRVRGERLLGKATRNIDANDLIWEFFSRHSLNKGCRP